MPALLLYKYRCSTLWLALFISLLAGLGLARTGPGFGTISIACSGIFLVLALSKQSLFTLILVVLFGVSCGWWRGAIFMDRLAEYEPLYDQKITIKAEATEDGIYNNTKQMAFSANDVVLENGQRLAGKVQLSGFGANAIYHGDEVIATGKLVPGYGAYQGRVSFAVLEVKAHHPSLIYEIRRKFIAGAQTTLPEPLGPFVMGLLVGQRATLPETTKDELRMVGLTHIIAVSGANLTIIVQACRKMMGRLSKRSSTFLSLVLISVFLLLAGSSAPIVRAAIVSVLSIATSYYGRSLKPLNLILFAAVITAFANPVYIWSDLSWYLSFLAFYGIMILAPLVQARWGIGKSVLGGVALESLCAEIITLPIVLHIFGQMSRVGLVANVLVVTLIPLAMLMGVVSGLAGMLMGSIAGWFTWPAVILLNYMLDVAHILAGLPNIFVEGIGLSLGQMLIAYICIAFFTAVLWYKNPRKSDIVTEMNQPKSRSLQA